jgi:ParB family chromosome partitioning protein
MTRRDRLGKGLGALLGEYMDPEVEPSEISKLPVKMIVPNPVQPRRVFTEEELSDLAGSIRENGLLQPLVVRPAPGSSDRFELIAGERRLRAVTGLGWEKVPVVVRDASDDTLLVLALVENLQRSALNPMEEAEAYAALGDQYGMSQAEIATAVGKDRSTVANLVRLLKLPPSVRKLVESGSLSMGHARALLSVTEPMRAAELARTAAKEGWSVREVERRAKSLGALARPSKTKAVDPTLQALQDSIRDRFSTRVAIKQGRGGKGSIEVKYHGPDDFERIFEMMMGKSVSEIVE